MIEQHIGLGTAAIGRPHYINIKQSSHDEFEKEAFKLEGEKILETAYNQGIRYFDTAPGYGLAEQLLIDWVKSKHDDEIELATKWGYTYVANFDPQAAVHEIKDHSVEKLNQQWEVSKQLLPNLSTLQIHSATLETGVLENKTVLDRLTALKSNHNLLIGLSTTGVNQVEVIKKALDVVTDGQPLFDVFQVTYNVLDQCLAQIKDLLLSSSKRIVIKEALANGRLFRNDSYPKYQKVYQTLEEMAQRYQVGVDAVALRFCLDSIAPFMVLSGAGEIAQIEQNLQVNTFELEADDLMTLNTLNVGAKDYWSERKHLLWN